jgi:hypothetical protein
MRKYLAAFSIVLAVVAALILLFYDKIPVELRPTTWLILGYFTLVTVLFHQGIISATRARPEVFVRFYMASTVFKLLLHLIVIISYAILNHDNARFFIIIFMIMYFIFTIFEVYYVTRKQD